MKNKFNGMNIVARTPEENQYLMDILRLYKYYWYKPIQIRLTNGISEYHPNSVIVYYLDNDGVPGEVGWDFLEKIGPEVVVFNFLDIKDLDEEDLELLKRLK